MGEGADGLGAAGRVPWSGAEVRGTEKPKGPGRPGAVRPGPYGVSER